MSNLHTFVNDILKKDNEFLQNEIQNLNSLFEEGYDYCTKVLSEINKYDKTGNCSVVDPPVNSSSASKRSSTKENVAPIQRSIAKQDNAKAKRNAFKETNQAPDQQLQVLSQVKIKAERVSKESNIQPEITPITDTVVVKTEKGDMPAPTQLPPRKKKIQAEPTTTTQSRSTRNRAKKTESDTAESSDEARPKRTRKKPVRYEAEEKRKDSDVILQTTPVTTVELSDSEDVISTTSEKIPESTTTKKTKAEESKNTRSTRTKTKNKVADSASSEQSQENFPTGKNKTTATKRGRIESSDEESNSQKNRERETKRSKSDSDHADNTPDKPNQEPSTVVSHNTNTVKNINDDFDKELFTDDESDTEFKTPPQRSNTKNNKKAENAEKKSGDKNKLQENVAMLDTTMVIEKPKYTETTLKTLVSDKGNQPNSVLNTTMVVDKGVTNNTGKSAGNPIGNGLLTDDESEEEIIRSPMKPQVKKHQTKGVKPIFSPFDPSPVKKKVEAFERLGAETSAIPTRVTRTKTRAQVKDQKENDNTTENDKKEDYRDVPRNVVKEKAKFFTPTISRFLPKSSSTNKLTHKLPVGGMNISTCNESMLSVKSASALKSSQAEYREREKQRREKESEALRKRELMIQAQIEEKKRKREEKQLKAQQHREVLEKEAQKKLEVQRIKEERHKKMIAEKEEKLQKQREDVERKRLLAKKRAIEEKKKEEQRQAEEQKKMDELKMKALKMSRDGERPPPIYLQMKAPLLPTDDCYDSDDPEFNTHKPKEPLWAKEEHLRSMQFCMIAARDNLKNTFFCRQATTPNLQELFECIDPRKLKRTSSAIWRKPPRYTLLPMVHEQDLVEDSSEDDY